MWAILVVLGLLITSAAGQTLDMSDLSEHLGGGVQFTRPDGTPVYINPRAVAFVRAPLEGEAGHAVIVFSSGAKQAVSETVEKVISGINIRQPGEKP